MDLVPIPNDLAALMSKTLRKKRPLSVLEDASLSAATAAAAAALSELLNDSNMGAGLTLPTMTTSITANMTMPQNMRAYERPVEKRLFRCTHTDCQMTFTRNTNLLRHMRLHSGEAGKVFSCDAPDCGRAFARRSDLVSHARTHSGSRPFICPTAGCSKSFAHSSSFARHRRTHLDFIADAPAVSE